MFVPSWNTNTMRDWFLPIIIRNTVLYLWYWIRMPETWKLRNPQSWVDIRTGPFLGSSPKALLSHHPLQCKALIWNIASTCESLLSVAYAHNRSSWGKTYPSSTLKRMGHGCGLETCIRTGTIRKHKFLLQKVPKKWPLVHILPSKRS